MTPESILHTQVCDYLRLQHRGVLFRTDFAAGEKLSRSQAIRQKRLQAVRGWPDLFVAEPRGGKAGLFIELKAEGTKLRSWDGSRFAVERYREQNDVLEQLKKRGYEATFGIGFHECQKIIDEYLSRT